MAIIRIRRGTTAQWNASTRILQTGELGLDTTLNKIKAGNGVNVWTSLPYLTSGGADDAALITEIAQDAVANAFASGTQSNIIVTYNDQENSLSLATGPEIVTVSSLENRLGDPVTGFVRISDVGNQDGVASLGPDVKIPDIEIPDGIARVTYVNESIANLVNSAPSALNTLNELATALGNDANFSTTITNSIALKAPIASPTFTGTVSGITKSMVGLTNVDNTSDASKPISTATQTALDLKLSTADPAVDYYVINSGSGAYLVNGVSNGTIYFERGKKYRVHVNASGHPFWIQTVSGGYSSGNVYSTGITNNGTQSGHIIVELPQNAPDNLYYACQFHSSMQGSISVQSQDAVTINSKSSSYAILPIDAGRLIEMSGGGTLTISDSTSFPTGFTVNVLQTGSSQVTIAGNGFTVNATPGLKLRAQWSSATLVKRGSNSWVAMGDLSV